MAEEKSCEAIVVLFTRGVIRTTVGRRGHAVQHDPWRDRDQWQGLSLAHDHLVYLLRNRPSGLWRHDLRHDQPQKIQRRCRVPLSRKH